MKFAIIIPDGAPGEPQAELAGRTPLQAARLPALDALAASGRLGATLTVGERQFPNEAAAHLAVLGYAPERHPVGEGALTAHARGIRFGPEDLVFCCDLVTVIDGYMRDFTAGLISAAEVTPLIAALSESFGDEGFRFYDCGGYRNVCVWEGAGPLAELRTTPPEQIVNQPTKRHMPPGSAARPLYNLMLRAEALLSEHDVNLVRQDLGENVASAIWLWGSQPLGTLPSFEQRYGVQGGLVTGSDIMRGIGSLIGWEVLEVPGATRQPDADLSAEGRTAVAAVDAFDVVCVHVHELFTLSAVGAVTEKVELLEAIDGQIVAPLVDRLRAEPEWRVLVIPARAAPTARSAQPAGRTMFVLAGSGIASNRGEAFDEENAAVGEMQPERAHHLMEYFLRR
jgi:2,3-bisphosphoglycerate-independent phosphoglycerate mutase